MAEIYSGGFLHHEYVSLSIQRTLTTTALIEPLRCKLPKFAECSWRNEELLKPEPLHLDSRIQVNIPLLFMKLSNPLKSA